MTRHVITSTPRALRQILVEPWTKDDVRPLLEHFVEDKVVRGEKKQQTRGWVAEIVV